MNESSGIEQLLTIMRRLRDPDNGCPWDLKQDFHSIAPYTLEEAYEVVDAIERGELEDLPDELGDLLLQVVFHAQMGQEAGRFGFSDVVGSICDKMIRRHPHVFGDVRHLDDDSLHAAWERQKHSERTHRRGDSQGGLLEGIAVALPALVRAEKLQRRASRGGFDWDHAEPVLDKIREELDECTAAMVDNAPKAALNEEIGDLLFSCVNLARHLKVDAEQALRMANAKFERRFHAVELGLRSEGLAPGVEQRDRMEDLWKAAKLERK